MSTAVAITIYLGAAIAIAAGSLLFARLKGVPRDPEASDDQSDHPSPAKISLVIPARNEADNLGQLLPSLNAQSAPAHEIIVVDDQSDDATTHVAREHGAQVVSGKALPDGWYGKPWACHQGAERATGDWLMFLDADLWLEPDALARLQRQIADTPDAAISVCPWHDIRQPYEQGSLFFNLLMLGGIGAFTILGPRACGIGLFGQCLLVSQHAYQTVGGHRRVRQTILENFHLSKAFAEHAIPRRCFLGKSCLSMRMFPYGPREMIDSWSKGFTSGAGLSSKLGLTLASVWLSGLMMLTVSCALIPLAPPAATHHLPLAAAYLAVALSLFWLGRQAGRFAWWNALLFPLSLIFYQWVFARSIVRQRRGQKTEWKGRHVA